MSTAKREALVKNFLDQRHIKKRNSRKAHHPLRGHRHLVTLSEEEIARREQGWNDRFSVDPPPKSNKVSSPPHSPTNSIPATPLTTESKIRNERAQYGKRGRNRSRREPKKPTSGRLVPLGALSNPPTESAQPTKEEKLRFKVLKAIDARETQLYQLSALILCTPVQETLFLPSRPAEPPTTNRAGRQQMRSRGGMALASTPRSRHGGAMTNAREATKLAQQLATELQITGIQCVEALVEWMLEAGAHAETPPPFLWRGRNYFLKMINDLDFAEAELQARGINLDCFKHRNPLLLKPNQKLGRVLAAHSIIMEMVEFAKDPTPMELLALSGRMNDSAYEENDDNSSDVHARAPETSKTGGTGLETREDSTGENLQHSTVENDGRGYEPPANNQVVDSQATAVDLVNLLDENLDFIRPIDSHEDDVKQITNADERNASDNNNADGSYRHNSLLTEKMVVGNDDWPTEVSEEKDKVAVEVEANEINIPINNQAEEEDIEDEHNEDEENNGGEDYEDHEDQDEVTIPTLSRLSVPPLAGSGKAAVNKAMPEEANSNDATDDCDTTSELDPHSSRTNDNSNLSEYDNGFDGKEANQQVLDTETQLPQQQDMDELPINRTLNVLLAPEDSDCATKPECTPAGPQSSKQNLTSRTEESNPEYDDNSFDDDEDTVDAEAREGDVVLTDGNLEISSDLTTASGVVNIQSELGMQFDRLVHTDSGLYVPEIDGPPSVSKMLVDELKRWSFLTDTNRPTEVNVQGCSSWCSARALTEALQRYSSIRECMNGSFISVLEQYELTAPETPLQSLLGSEAAKKVNLVTHVIDECQSILGDICSSVVEAMHLSLRSKNSLVSEIEISELLEVAESVRRDYHASTWEYLKIATTLLAFIRATGGGQDHEKSSSVSAGLTQLVKVFYPYLVNQPREKLSDNWDSVKREFAAMEMNIDYLYFLLDPMCKTLLLAVNLCGSSKKDADGDDVYPKITVICDRDDILRSTVDYISLHHFSGMKALANFSLFPFFKSTFGEKLVDGVRVEEGEGKGPLKEWFGLVGMELASKWKRVSIPTISSVPDLNEVTVSGNAITIPAASGNAGGICAGFQLEWEGSDEVVIRRVVNKYVGDGSYLLDRSVPSHSFSVSQLRASQPIAAFFEYVQGSESFWLNENTCDSPENRKTLDFVGWFFACAFTHFCSIQLKIHPLLFRMLLDSSYCVTPEDLRLFNPPLFKSLNEMKDMKPSDFAEYLKFEGADEGLSVEKYIDEVVAEKFGPESSVGWQLDAIRQGFSRVIPVEQVGRVGMTGEDLASVIYGDSSDRGGEEFTVSTVFRIAADPDFTSCRPLSKAFWQTVNNYEPHMKRKFIKFVTGVDTLPLAGTEFLRIEMPFTAISADDHKKSLGMLPQAHTCDNTLELPHYWKALCWRNQHNEHEADSDLEAELIALLRKKLQDAVEYSCGYGLDGTAEVSGVLVRNSGANDDDQLVNASYDSLGLPALSERSSTADPVPNTTQPSPPEPATEEDSSSHVEDRVLNSPEKPAPVASPRQEESYEDYDWEEEDAEQ